VIDTAVKAVEKVLNAGITPAMNYYNGLEILPLDRE